MNYNIAAYLIYLALITYIIIYVGRYCFVNGRVFIIASFKGNVEAADHLNKLLLIAYYLFNIGYAFLKLRTWTKVTNSEMLVSSISLNLGVLILILGVTHYLNMILVYVLSKSKTFFLIDKLNQS